jgi:hypothetical protein
VFILSWKKNSVGHIQNRISSRKWDVEILWSGMEANSERIMGNVDVEDTALG